MMEEIKICGRCKKPKGETAESCKCGRPPMYSEEMLSKSQEYLDSCKDIEIDRGTPERPNLHLNVKIPTRGGLASYLGVSRDALYDWAKQYPEFSNIIEQLGASQEDRLVNNGLSGDYNPTIAKVLLTKHGYREGIDQTTNNKDLPTPIMEVRKNVLPDHSNKEDCESYEED